MRKILILIGIPASGKSTYALQFLKDNPSYYRVNRDSIRRMMIGDVYDYKIEKIVTLIQDHAIEVILGQGKNVLIDATNVKQSYIEDVYKIAKRIGGIEVSHKVFDVPFEECMRRNNLREGVERVPMDIMIKMQESFSKMSKEEKTVYFPKTVKTFERDEKLPKAIIVDVDGTLAINTTRSPFDWKKVKEDSVNEPIVDLVRMYFARGIRVIIFSGRDSICRSETIEWLNNNKIPFHDLYMRKENDNRKDSIVKRELYEANIKGKYNVLVWIDDRNQVVREMRDLGITVLQVADGNF